MNKILVIKFGGTSLSTVDRIKNAAKIVAAASAEGKKVIVVVSAMGNATDDLIKLSEAIDQMPDRRELDALMATGEQQSATLMAMALQSLGCRATSFNGDQSGILTNADFGNATIEKLELTELSRQIKDDVIPVVTGFQGIAATGDTTTLGRGGSDITAIALAAALHAERCDIYSDVDGIYSADPRVTKSAEKLKTISYADMLELAKHGAQILNPRSVVLAMNANVPVRVRSTFMPNDQGTLLTAENKGFNSFVGIATCTTLNCIEIDLDRLELGPTRSLRSFALHRLRTNRELHELLLHNGIDAEIIEAVRPHPFRILLLLKKADTARAIAVLNNTALAIRRFRIITDLASITLVAIKMTAKYHVDALNSLTKHNIPITGRTWHNRRLTLLVPISMFAKATDILHAEFAALLKAA